MGANNTIFLSPHMQGSRKLLSCCAACDEYLNMTCAHAYETSSKAIKCDMPWWGVAASQWQGCLQVDSYSTTTSTNFVCTCSEKASGYEVKEADQKCSCAVGHERTGSGTTSQPHVCSQCAAGEFKAAVGTSTCGECKAGTYSLAGASACTDCERGTYASSDKASTCSACAANSTTLDTKRTAASQCVCKAGYTGSTCRACPAGTYKSTTGSSDCTACGAGNYSDAPAATACNRCPSTSPNSAAGSTSNSSCYLTLSGGLCSGNRHNCDVNALCAETNLSFTCTCKPGYVSRHSAIDWYNNIISYGLTFVATGCCNYQAENSYWLSTSPSNVFHDMYTYCTLVKDGSASASERSLCGCGATPPSTCTLQTDFRYWPRPPPLKVVNRSTGIVGDCIPVGACERGDSFHSQCADNSTKCTSNLHTFSRQNLAVSAEATGQGCSNGRDGTWKMDALWIGDSDPPLQVNRTFDNYQNKAGSGSWVTAPAPFRGSSAFLMTGSGTFHHTFTGPFSIPAGATDFIAHVFLPQGDPAAEVMVRLKLPGRAWKQAYYGEANIGWSPYGLTFVATGCCNYQAENSYWLSTSPSNVFNDMYTYCTLVKGGSASASQRSLCGCGATPPSTCTLQSAYTYSPRPPATNMGQISNLTTGEWRQLCVPLGLFFDHTDARDPVEYLSLTAWSATQSNITWDHVGVGKCGLDYSCSCATGYLPGTEKCVGSKFKCDDINECANLNASNLCDAANSYCSNTPGSFVCACNRGYQNDDPAVNRACSDSNECLTGAHNCAADGGVCSNTEGSFTCACYREGVSYTGNGLSCTRVGACELKNHSCHSNATCTSHLPAGNFSCACNRGFRGNGERCENVNECQDVDLRHNCDQNADCTDTIGSFLCKCRNWAYTGAGTDGTCQLTGKCELNLDNCASNATCTSTETGFNCTCDAGFAGNGTVCNDINECARNQSNCDALLGRCTNTFGSFTCACDPSILGKDPIAYIDANGDGTKCQDRNECIEGRNVTGGNNCDPNAACTNTDGSFTCACNLWDYTSANYDGFAGDTDRVAAAGDGTSCIATGACINKRDSCARNISICNSTGFKTAFECPCATGFAKPESATSNPNGTDCGDIEECALCKDDCAEEAECTNTVGSFLCTCSQPPGWPPGRAGYVGNGTVCVDVCTSGDNDCHANATCMLEPDDGTYSCSCISEPGEYRFFGDGWKDTVGIKWKEVGVTTYNLAKACGTDQLQNCTVELFVLQTTWVSFGTHPNIVDGDSGAARLCI